jgi:hypothetical protein
MLMQVVEIYYDHGQDRYSLREAKVNSDNIEYTRPNRRIVLAETAVPTGLNMSEGFTDVHFRSGVQMTIVGGAEKLNTRQLLRG